MRSLRYLNCVLTVLAILLSLQLWTAWSTSSVSMAHEAHAQGIPDAGAQRKEMIDALARIQQELTLTNELLRSGQLRVVVDQPRSISQPTSVRRSTRSSNLISQLQIVRSQLELYMVQHNGQYPDLETNGWDLLTLKTTAAHATLAAGTKPAAGVTYYGPYLRLPPRNPFTNGSAIGVDWSYDKKTGSFLPRLTEEQAKQAGLEDGQFAPARP